MPQIESAFEPASFNLNDLIFTVFRHKWKLLACLTVGFVAAGIAYFRYIPEYESEAKLLVRYVVDKSSVDANYSNEKPSGASGASLMAAEVDILTSWDLLQKVAENLTIERVIPRAGPNAPIIDAVYAIQSGLRVSIPRGGGSVITVFYRSRDPELARTVLNRLVTEYFEKHLEVHRSIGTFDFVSQQTDQLRSRLIQTEEDLKKLKAKAGIRSLENLGSTIDSRMKALQSELDLAEAQQAEQEANVVALERSLGGLKPQKTDVQTPASPIFKNKLPGVEPQKTDVRASNEVPSPPDEEAVERYQELVADLKNLSKIKPELRARYTPENRILKMNQAEIANLRAELRDLENAYPGIGAAVPTQGPDLGPEKARLAAIDAKVEKLKSQILDVDGAATRLSEVETEITQLERKKQADEKNYMYFQSSLERARIDEALDPSKIPNISIVQTPSPATLAPRDIKVKKLMYGLVGGGLALGVALVLLTELILDPSVKRPSELQVRMGIPLLLSIPYFERCDRRRLLRRKRDREPTITPGEESSELALFGEALLLRQSFESIRDRLIVFFELNNLKHRPKLVAVTGCSDGGGTSTIAGGLAAALAETGDGKVLLVDMNGAHAAIHPFFEGRPSCTVAEALQAETTIPSASENLYLAKPEERSAGSLQLVPRRFSDMVPHFKASVYDYIVFDMPPLDQSCAVLAIAGSVDKVLLVVETGKTHREAVKRTYGELVAARANVSCILNKNKSFGSRWIQKGS